jgi:hypothetical protein
MKMLTLHDIISVHDNQKEAQNIEKTISKAQGNINSLESSESQPPKPLDMPQGQTNLKDEEDTKSAPLEDTLLERKVIIGTNLSNKKESELLAILRNNKDIFTWSASDLQGVSRDIIGHSLVINPNVRPKYNAR